MRWNVVGNTISYKLRHSLDYYDLSTKEEILSSVSGVRLVVCKRMLSPFEHKDACEILFDTSIFTLQQAESFINSSRMNSYEYYENKQESEKNESTPTLEKKENVDLLESGTSVDIKEALPPSSDFVVDRKNKMIKGVSIMKLNSRNGRKYLKKAIQEAKSLYESAPFFVDHKPGDDSRSPRDFGGKFINIREGLDRNGEFVLKGDVEVLEKESFLFEVAERMPDRLGFSHHAKGLQKVVEGKDTIIKILEVHSIDLVCNPATTSSLFESVSSTNQSEEKKMESPATVSVVPEKQKEKLTFSVLQESYPEILKEARKDLESEIFKLRKELDVLQLKEKIQLKESLISQTLKKYEIKESDVTDTFMEMLREADSESKVEKIAKDRSDLLKQITTPVVAPVSVKKPTELHENFDKDNLYKKVVEAFK